MVKNQRDRLTAGIIAVVAERGYQDATVSQICAAAGVSRRTFYSYFSSKKDCYFDAFTLLVDFLTTALEDATPADVAWPQQVRARLGVLLGIFAANPDLVRFALIAPMRAGEEIGAGYREALERLLASLVAESGGKPVKRPSPAVEQALLGGMISLIAKNVEEGRGERLGDLLPDLVELFLTPYLGRAEAVQAKAVPH